MAKCDSPDGFVSTFASVGVSGDTIVLGGPTGTSEVTAYICLKGTKPWRNPGPMAELKLPIGIDASTSSVAIDGDTVVIGAFALPGVAYIYVRPPGGWTDMTPTATLTASNPPDIYFGQSVFISGDTVVVGDTGYGSPSPGVAYVFVKPAGGWTNMTQTATLASSDGVVGDNFGYSVSISGSTIAVGAPQFFGSEHGKGYVFVEPATGWTDMTETAELTAPDAPGSAVIGISISNTEDLVVAGGDAFATNTSGAAYLFEKPGSGWTDMTETATLTPIDPYPDEEFGVSVGVSGKLVAVGANRRALPPNGLQGGVYIFEKPLGGWKNLAGSTVLTGADAHHIDFFANSVAIWGRVVVAGAPRFYAPGAAYAFELP